MRSAYNRGAILDCWEDLARGTCGPILFCVSRRRGSTTPTASFLSSV